MDPRLQEQLIDERLIRDFPIILIITIILITATTITVTNNNSDSYHLWHVYCPPSTYDMTSCTKSATPIMNSSSSLFTPRVEELGLSIFQRRKVRLKEGKLFVQGYIASAVRICP